MKKVCFGVLLLGIGCFPALSAGFDTTTETMRASSDSKEHEIGMFTTTADARVVVSHVNKGRFCAEPPPETQVTESSNFKLLLEAALKGGENVKVEAMRAYTESLHQLYKRSHTNQLYRDASYYLCQVYLNSENLSKDEYLKAQKDITTEAFKALKEEHQVFYDAQKKLEEGKVAAYREGLEQLTNAVKALEDKIEKAPQAADGKKVGEGKDDAKKD